MTIRTRMELVCDMCSKALILPSHIKDELAAFMGMPGKWRTVQWDAYGNCSTFCSKQCEERGRLEVQLAEEGE